MASDPRTATAGPDTETQPMRAMPGDIPPGVAMRLAAPRWSSEAAMLNVIQEAARARGWRCCPESAGHDLVLVVGDDCGEGGLRTGDQIAVEGKLRPTVGVLAQALPADLCRTNRTLGADFYAVATPGSDADFRALAYALGVVVIDVPADPRPHHRPPLDALLQAPSRYRRTGLAPLRLPSIDVVMRAGEPSPRILTPWKIAAVRLCLIGQQRPLTTADFKATPVRHRTFVDRGWMEPVSLVGRSATYALLEHPGRPDAVYPEIVAAIEAAPDFGAGVMTGLTAKE